MKPKLKVGHIYILTNPAMPEFVKIGYTRKETRLRASELSNTSVPLPYEVYYEELVEYPSVIERLIHSQLNNYRVSPDREFFKVKPEHAEEELNLILYGSRDFRGNFPKQLVSLLSLKEKHPEYFLDKEIEPKTKYLMFKALESLDTDFRAKARAENSNYEKFMGMFEDRTNPRAFEDALDDT